MFVMVSEIGVPGCAVRRFRAEAVTAFGRNASAGTAPALRKSESAATRMSSMVNSDASAGPTMRRVGRKIMLALMVSTMVAPAATLDVESRPCTTSRIGPGDADEIGRAHV